MSYNHNKNNPDLAPLKMVNGRVMPTNMAAGVANAFYEKTLINKDLNDFVTVNSHHSNPLKLGAFSNM